MRTRPCETCGQPVFQPHPISPIPRNHPECWKIARGGSASGQFQRKLREKGQCVDCRKYVGEKNERTGLWKARCATCSRIRREAYRERVSA